jgi:hypothetical protein
MLIYVVSKLAAPQPEEYAVMMIDTSVLVDGGVAAKVESLHSTKVEAEAAAELLRGNAPH